MDIYEWLVEQEQETLLHLEDEQRSKTGVFEMKYHISHSRAFSQINMDIPVTMAQQCKQCLLNFETQEIRLDCLCDACRAKAVGFHVGDTIRITSEDLDGQQGELKVIDPEASEGEFFGVYIEHVGSLLYFAADEIEKVSK